MFRAAAAIKTVFLACVLGGAAHAGTQVSEDRNPASSCYEMLGKQHVSQPTAPQGFEQRRENISRQSHSKKVVMDAIWTAAQHSGVDYHYLLAKAHLESGLNPKAKASSSSAAGLFQFIESTWLRSLERYASQIQTFRARQIAETDAQKSIDQSETKRSDRLEWRHDPHLASLMAAAYAQENGDKLKGVLGRQANSTELYVAHFLGSGGSVRFMSAWKRNPHQSAASLFPRAARANRSIFYYGAGRPRSLQNVLEYFERKMSRALVELGLVADQAGKGIHALHSPNDSIFSFGSSSQTTHLLQTIKSTFEEISSRRSGQRQSTQFERTYRPQASFQSPQANERHRSMPISRSDLDNCNHIEMCYLGVMSTSTITLVRNLIDSGAYTKAGIARAAGLHANTLRDASETDWNPTTETLAKLQKFLDANDDTPVLVGAEEIIDEARNGRMYILVDDEDRENEGDLIIPAQMATPAAVNFMATHGRGLICLALDKARVDALGLDPMSRNNKESMQTAFTVSIEAKEGVTTGISAADRARTISVAIDASKGADDIVTPGHVFPLMARDGGTLVRAGHTEAAVDISRLAGLNPSGVICEIMNEDGSMARLDDLIEFARKHSLKIGTIRDLIAYRMRNDHLVERIDERSFESDYGGQWRMITYRNTISDNEAYVLQKGHVSPEEPTLARVHPISVFDDVLGAPGPRKRTLQRAMSAIGEKGAGVIVILTQRVGQGTKWTQDEEHRNIGIGSQILADLGVHEMILLSNSRPDLVALEGYGITLAGHQSIPE